LFSIYYIFYFFLLFFIILFNLLRYILYLCIVFREMLHIFVLNLNVKDLYLIFTPELYLFYKIYKILIFLFVL